MKVVPPTCSIASGSSKCSVAVQGTNPGKVPLQIWVKGPSENQEKVMTAVFTDPTFSYVYNDVAAGTTTFYLYELTGGSKQLRVTTTAIGLLDTAHLDISFSPDPVPRAGDGKWHFTVIARETKGVGVTLTGLLINGVDYTNSIQDWFGTTHIVGNSGIKADLVLSTSATPPFTSTFVFKGNDDNGNVNLSWSGSVTFTP